MTTTTAEELRSIVGSLGVSHAEAASISCTAPRRFRRMIAGEEMIHPASVRLLALCARFPEVLAYCRSAQDQPTP